MTIGVSGRLGYLSLLLSVSLFMPYYAVLRQVEIEFCPASFVVLGNLSCLVPKNPALSEDPWRDSVCFQYVVCFVGCVHCVVNPWLKFVCWFVLWYTAEKEVAAGIVVAVLERVVRRRRLRQRSRRVQLRGIFLNCFSFS